MDTKHKTKGKPRTPPPKKEPTPNVLRKSGFDTKNYYYYTEIRKD